jgi:class 3 adenylate cyclase
VAREQRKLAAILAADVVGYSRLIGVLVAVASIVIAVLLALFVTK